MKYLALVILGLSMGACSTSGVSQGRYDHLRKPAAVKKVGMFKNEKYKVVEKCYNMVVLSVDNCPVGSAGCTGYVRPEGSDEVLYAIFQKNKKQGDISQNCYITREDTGETVSNYFHYTFEGK